MEKQFTADAGEVYREVRGDPALLSRFCEDLLPWYGMYDRTVEEQTALLSQSFGLTPLLREAASASDPNAALLELGQTEIPEDWVGNGEARNAIVKRFGLTVGLLNTLDGLGVFGKFINELVAEGRAADR